MISPTDSMSLKRKLEEIEADVFDNDDNVNCSQSLHYYYYFTYLLARSHTHRNAHAHRPLRPLIAVSSLWN